MARCHRNVLAGCVWGTLKCEVGSWKASAVGSVLSWNLFELRCCGFRGNAQFVCLAQPGGLGLRFH
jgi:hypothetical protein